MIFEMRKYKILKPNIIGFGVFILLILTLSAKAQQEPLYTQYSFNTQTINPAYAGTWGNMGFLALARNQWAGLEGTPKTYNLSFQSTTRNKDVGLGVSIISDRIGREKRLSLFGDYSYRLKIDDISNLRLGLKFGIANYQNNLSEYLQYPGPVDPVSQADIEMQFVPNFGIGAYLYSTDYFVGLSIPKIIENKYSQEDNERNYSTTIEMRHLFLIAGYVFNLSEYLKFKPTFLTRASVGAPLNFEITANFLLNDKIWLGTNYRTRNTFGIIAQWIFEENLRVGYAIDFTFGGLQQFNNGTHEIMVSYEIGSKREWTTPRMF